MILMPNHFDWVIETPQPNPVAGMKWLLGEWGMPEDSPAGRQRLERALEERRGAKEGEEKFWEELLTQMRKRMGAEH
jgi:hypothetical protein